jgi:hypothetical protein
VPRLLLCEVVNHADQATLLCEGCTERARAAAMLRKD